MNYVSNSNVFDRRSICQCCRYSDQCQTSQNPLKLRIDRQRNKRAGNGGNYITPCQPRSCNTASCLPVEGINNCRPIVGNSRNDRNNINDGCHNYFLINRRAENSRLQNETARGIEPFLLSLMTLIKFEKYERSFLISDQNGILKPINTIAEREKYPSFMSSLRFSSMIICSMLCVYKF